LSGGRAQKFETAETGAFTNIATVFNNVIEGSANFFMGDVGLEQKIPIPNPTRVFREVAHSGAERAVLTDEPGA
jgi:hypothetical protein